MYRNRSTQSKKMANMREAKERKRMNGVSPNYPAVLPDLRRVITITDYDFGEVTHTIELYQTGRVDQYRATADDQPWKDHIGWAKVLEGIRKSFLRVRAV